MISEKPSEIQPGFSIMESTFRRRWVVLGSVLLLLTLMFIQLAITARLHSMTVDEGNHIYSGYMSWTRFDFGLNPEHPPLVKLLATVPLLAMKVSALDPSNAYFKLAAYEGGKKLLSGEDKETILFRTRMSSSKYRGSVSERLARVDDAPPAIYCECLVGSVVPTASFRPHK